MGFYVQFHILVIINVCIWYKSNLNSNSYSVLNLEMKLGNLKASFILKMKLSWKERKRIMCLNISPAESMTISPLHHEQEVKKKCKIRNHYWKWKWEKNKDYREFYQLRKGAFRGKSLANGIVKIELHLMKNTRHLIIA